METIAPAAGAAPERELTREEQEQEMLEMLELIRTHDPERYEALIKAMQAEVNPGGYPPLPHCACVRCWCAAAAHRRHVVACVHGSGAGGGL